MVSLRFKAALLALFVICPMAVNAQEICSEKLLSPNIQTNMTDVRTRTYFRDAMCFLDYQKFVDKYGADTGASYFEISGFGNFNAEKYRETQRVECRDITKEHAASSLSYSSESVVPIEARKQYVDCVSRQPLVCAFDKEESAPLLRISHHSDTNGPTIIRSVETSSNITYAKTNLKKGSELLTGFTNVNVKVRDAEAVRITINVKRAGAADTCTAFIAKAVLTPVVELKIVRKRICSCPGQGGFSSLRFWGPEGEDCNGLRAWGAFAQDCKPPDVEIARCIGHGSLEGVGLWGPKGELCASHPGWGKYSVNPVSHMTTEMCGCAGQGDKLARHRLWGPKGAECGAGTLLTMGWGVYDAACTF